MDINKSCDGREWNDYVEARDNQEKLQHIPDSEMTKELWRKWHDANRVVEEKHSIYDIDSLNQRYEDSLIRL